MSESERRPGPSVRLRVTEHTAVADRRHEDRVATEEPLEIRVASSGAAPRRVWVTMRTPGHDFELAAGFAVNESLVAREQIRRVAYCTDDALRAEEEFNVVTLTVEGDVAHQHRHAANSAGSSACGVCGKDSVSDVLQVTAGRPWSGAIPSAAVLRGLPASLREHQTLFARTGGVHAAGLADADGVLSVVREDVGRHNAVDKVVGARVLAGESPASACLVVSGRAGFELVQKAVTSGVGSLAAVGAPSSLAVRLARESGMALFGFTSADRCVRYA